MNGRALELYKQWQKEKKKHAMDVAINCRKKRKVKTCKECLRYKRCEDAR